jgi:hypothetical protein|tara:strand:- start:676 stop:861 length:186 start_codon:yes stop_codon:yes gene_type:complete
MAEENVQKRWFQSKTIGLAILQGVAGVVAAFATEFDTVGWVVVIKSVVDIALRYYTKEPVA